MIRTLKIIFCDEEHGVGDVTFPDMATLHQQQFVADETPATVPQLRKQAKAAGWSHHSGGDYCPGCTEHPE